MSSGAGGAATVSSGSFLILLTVIKSAILRDDKTIRYIFVSVFAGRDGCGLVAGFSRTELVTREEVVAGAMPGGGDSRVQGVFIADWQIGKIL